MFKINSIFINIFLLGIVVSSISFAQNVQIAGAIRKQEDSTPFVDIDPSVDVTNIANPTLPKNDEDIDFQADEIESDEKNGTIIASGNVTIKYSSMVLIADKIYYDQINDKITANGNVEFTEQNGNIIYADNIVVSEHMNKAFMEKIKVKMVDGTIIFADTFRKKANDDKVIENVMYTPCNFCEEIAPLWQINAKKVKHDASRQDIYYNNAILKIKEIPVLYTPFLSHPDPKVKRRSGFLAPTIGSSKYLGATIETPYFIDINEHQDLVVTPIFSTDKGLVLGGDYRQYITSGEINVSGFYVNDNDEKRGEHRGNVFTDFRYEINDNWVFDTNLKYVSDDLFIKEMSLPEEDDAWLMSNMKLSMFDYRDYASIESYYYKLISYNLKENNEKEYLRQSHTRPFVAPLMTYENISNPSSIGSYFKNDFSMASIYHEDDNSTQRLSMKNSWILPYTSPFGEKYRFIASLKSDLYYVNSYRYTQNDSYTGDVSRIFPQGAIEWKYPFIKTGKTSSQILEPIILAVFAPVSSNKDKRIPNEDSMNIELDDTNIFNIDRYAGYDRNDNGSRISYGFNWSSYGNILGRTSALIAQTYKLNKDEDFSIQSKQNGKFSDYVGRIYASPNEYLDLNYRFRLNKDNMKIQYNELGASLGNDIIKMYASYIYMEKNFYDYENLDERHELYVSLEMLLFRDWSISIYNRQDLADGSKSLEHGGSLIYEDECLKFATKISKYNSNDPDLDNGYSFGFTFYLKTLGGFGS